MSTVYDTLLTAITANGDTDLDLITGRDYIVAIGGTFDSASLTFFLVDQSGNEIPLPEAASTDGSGSPLTVIASAVFIMTAATSVLRITTASAGGSAGVDVTATLVKEE